VGAWGASGVDVGYGGLGNSRAVGATGAGAADDRTTGVGVEGEAAGVGAAGVGAAGAVATRSGAAEVEAASTGVAGTGAVGAAGAEGAGEADVDVGEGGGDPARKKPGGEERVVRVTGPGDRDREAEVPGLVVGRGVMGLGGEARDAGESSPGAPREPVDGR
jgi:hypothetical protein